MNWNGLEIPALELPERKKHTRHLVGGLVRGDVILRLSPLGYCNWCGKLLIGRSKFFCSKSKRVVYNDYEQEEYWCTREFYAWWHSYPRFKRAVYIRDNFTCQACGIKPITQNRYGLSMPDLSLLAIDHVRPFSKGGETKEDNLQVLCRKCNSKKKAKLEYVPQPSFPYLIRDAVEKDMEERCNAPTAAKNCPRI